MRYIPTIAAAITPRETTEEHMKLTGKSFSDPEDVQRFGAAVARMKQDYVMKEQEKLQMNESSEYQDLRRQEIQLARLRAKWGGTRFRVTARWLQGCPAPMLAELITLWQLEWNVEDNATSGVRYERALWESRRRMIQLGVADR